MFANSLEPALKLFPKVCMHKRATCAFMKLVCCCYISSTLIFADLIIILEYCSENNLKHYLRKNKSTFLESSVPQNQSGVHYVTLGTGGYASIESLG